MKSTNIYRKPDFINTLNVPPHPSWAVAAPLNINIPTITENKR
jgi:hypothetical protein